MSGFVALGAALLCACANPTRRADALAASLDFSNQIETGSGFRHLVYRNARATRDGILHVYIEGDGTPFRHRDTIAADPTPEYPLMLRLMALDSARSIYLGRPCYFELHLDQDCSAAFWTHRRYGPEVLDSMEAVLRAEADKAGATRVALFGHSGGGTLAVLLAQRVNAVTRVVTIGANLDVRAWCALHRFTPLAGSLNPADQRPGRVDLETLHLVGENDSNTPPSLVQAAARDRGGEPVRVIAHFDHKCCWASVWPEILSEGP
jgi:hypothetical protein